MFRVDGVEGAPRAVGPGAGRGAREFQDRYLVEVGATGSLRGVLVGWGGFSGGVRRSALNFAPGQNSWLVAPSEAKAKTPLYGAQNRAAQRTMPSLESVDPARTAKGGPSALRVLRASLRHYCYSGAISAKADRARPRRAQKPAASRQVLSGTAAGAATAA